jgi:hypothetical protein
MYLPDSILQQRQSQQCSAFAIVGVKIICQIVRVNISLVSDVLNIRKHWFVSFSSFRTELCEASTTMVGVLLKWILNFCHNVY